MQFLDILKYSWITLKNRKKRTFLTLLGILIGIASIIALLSLGTGFEIAIEEEFQKGFSTNTLTISKQTSLHSRTDFEAILYVNDTSLIEQIDGVESATAIIQKQGFIIENETIQSVIYYGVNFTEYQAMFPSFKPEMGAIPTVQPVIDPFIQENASKVVLGNQINKIWAGDNASKSVGNNITFYWAFRDGDFMETEDFTREVAGVLEFIGGYSSFGAPSDLAIYLDISVAMEMFDTEECSMIVAQISDTSDAAIAHIGEEIKAIFGPNVGVFTMEAMRDTIKSSLQIVTLFLAAIGGISLIVAGFGIMNIMTISLMERTREIGILKAMGMKDYQLLGMFLLEAIIIGIFGSILGILCGWLLATGSMHLLNSDGGLYGRFSGNSSGTSPLDIPFMPILTLLDIGRALLFGTIVSVVFAFLPARRAASYEPLLAIRYE